jgi:hypothetical protein
MSKSKQPKAVRPAPEPAAFDEAAELRLLALRIEELVTTAGATALDSALRLAASPTTADIERARVLADELAERSSRLELEIGRTLLGARIR